MAPIRPILRLAGVTEQQWRVLRVLADEGASDASHLGQAALLHAPSVTRILKELGERGLISRVTDPSDGRRSIVSISAQGADLVATVAQQTHLLLRKYATTFGAGRLANLQDELKALSEAVAEFAPDNGTGED